jgi:cobalt-zinc-cadmium efflux system membrane fusion protein
VTGSVSPDVSRELPVLSLANGRVVALHVGLGDFVKKGQLVMEVQSPDVTTAFDTYLKAVHDEHLTKVTLDRDKLLYDKGAIPQSQLQAAQNAEDDAKADLTAAEQQLTSRRRQESSQRHGQGLRARHRRRHLAERHRRGRRGHHLRRQYAGSLLIADLSHVWVICDVYENDLARSHLGQHADIRLNAFPGKVLLRHGFSDIGAHLDPSIRTAKVRIQVPNPGNLLLRIGMFATATLSQTSRSAVAGSPPTAVLQLHDRSYVFVPTNGRGNFRRVEIKTGRTIDGNMSKSSPALAPDSRSSPTHSTCRTRRTSNDRKIVDFSLNNRFIILIWPCCCSAGERSPSTTSPSRPTPTSPTTTSRSSPSGPAAPPKRSSSRSPSARDRRWPASRT